MTKPEPQQRLMEMEKVGCEEWIVQGCFVDYPDNKETWNTMRIHDTYASAMEHYGDVKNGSQIRRHGYSSFRVIHKICQSVVVALQEIPQ